MPHVGSVQKTARRRMVRRLPKTTQRKKAEGSCHVKDVIVVGGGLAGLSAAWRLRHWDTALLESGCRVGGRIRSERRGAYWLNWGGHIFAGPGTSTDALLHEAGITAAQVPGSLVGLAMNGKLALGGRIETYPFRIPMPLSSRIALIKAGIKVGGQVLRYAAVTRQRPGEDPSSRQPRTPMRCPPARGSATSAWCGTSVTA